MKLLGAFTLLIVVVYFNRFEAQILFRPINKLLSCDDPSYDDIEDILDCSELTLDENDELSTVVGGYCLCLIDTTPTIKMSYIVEKLNRDKWLIFLYPRTIPDMCASLVDPMELWSPAIKHMDDSSLVCPPKAGQKITFNNVSYTLLKREAPRSIAGKYRVINKFVEGNGNKYCFMYEMDALPA